MTYSEFKDELYLIKENRRIMRSILKSLSEVEDNNFSRLNNGAVDYSKERLQTSRDNDKAIIEAISKIDKDRERLLEKLKELKETNEYFENLIFNLRGVGGEVMRLFFIEGVTMKEIAEKRLYYSPQYCWEILQKTMKDLYRKEEAKNEKV